MTQLETKYAGLILKNPFLIGSSGLTNNAKKNKTLEEAGAGAIVLKSLFEEQIERQSDLFMQGAESPESADYIRNYVTANQVEEYLTLIRESKSVCTIPVIASINCYKASAWTEFARRIEEAGADALELNVFFLCTDPATSPDEMYDRYVSILKKVRTQVSIPIILKIGKSFSNIPGLVHQLKLHGAQGVVLFNRYYRPDIDIHKMQIVSGEVFSASAELSDTLRWTALVAGAVPGISLSSSCGVHSGADAVKCLLTGADTVQLCSTVYRNGTQVITRIREEVERWMKEQKYESADEFRGRLSFANIADPSLYERAQFMKYFSDHRP
jgi:dihydroorotate dehydrogenase (fumarate)